MSELQVQIGLLKKLQKMELKMILKYIDLKFSSSLLNNQVFHMKFDQTEIIHQICFDCF